MKIAVVGIKNAWSTELLVNAVLDKTGSCCLVDMNSISELRLSLPSGDCWYQGENLAEYDAIIIKKIGKEYKRELHDRLDILAFLEKRGVQCFSSAQSINNLLNRLSCTLLLQNAGIPMPATTITENYKDACHILHNYKRAIIKPLYTSKARGMLLLEEGNDTQNKENEKKLKEFQEKYTTIYIQKALDISAGFDIGLVFLGGEYLTTYARCKTNSSWNTTTVNGGKYASYKPSQELIDLAYKAQAPFNLAFTCVDIALAPEPYVFEVSAFGGFRGIVETSNIQPAQLLVDYVLKQVKK